MTTVKSKLYTPEFLIIGTMKGGTTVLYDFICKHPNVATASQKEIHYFSLNYTKGEEWYQEYFKQKKSDTIIGEASPTYFDMATTPIIPNIIKNDLPDVKIIVIVRDPIERALSHYNHFCKVNKIKKLQDMGPERFFNMPYANAIKGTTQEDTWLYHVLNFSCYCNKYKIYRSIFGDNLLVLTNDELRQKPYETMEKVQSYLSLDSFSSDIYEQVKYSAGTTLDQISVETQRKLGKFLYPDYEMFCKAAGVEFNSSYSS